MFNKGYFKWKARYNTLHETPTVLTVCTP